jgi:hypothetical protein
LSSKKKTDAPATPEATPVAASEEKTPPEATTEPETPQKATESAPDPLDWVKVRFSGEMGILAGRAVHGGEVHRVRYWQYLQARRTGGEAYRLVE